MVNEGQCIPNSPNQTQINLENTLCSQLDTVCVIWPSEVPEAVRGQVLGLDFGNPHKNSAMGAPSRFPH